MLGFELNFSQPFFSCFFKKVFKTCILVELLKCLKNNDIQKKNHQFYLKIYMRRIFFRIKQNRTQQLTNYLEYN